MNGTARISIRSWWPLLVVLAALLAYLPTFAQPLLEDDFPNIRQAVVYGEDWFRLARDAVFRLRLTSWVQMERVHAWAGMTPWPYYASSLLVHVVNCLLIFGLGRLRFLGPAAAAGAAFFFAVHEGHQEAIMWLSGSTEVFQFCGGLVALLALLRVQEGVRPVLWSAVSATGYAFALLSKESGVILLPLFAITLAWEYGWRRVRWPWLIPHVLLTGLAFLSVIESRRVASFRFNDGSFSLQAPFVLTLGRSLFALAWPWALAAVLFLAARHRWRQHVRGLVFALAWAVIAFGPYLFLTYTTRVPSRQTYLPSLGAALIVGIALTALPSKRWVATVLTVCLLHNVGYLWTVKRRQFLERAAPTEQLIGLARRTTGPIYVRCFPRTSLVAEEAIRMALGRDPNDLVWSAEEAKRRGATTEFCYQEPR